MNIKKELQKAFPHHRIHHAEKTLFLDEKYFIFLDKRRKLCLQLHSDSYLVYTLNKETLFPFPPFTKAEKAIDFMRWIYEYTIWLKSSK